ncbi:UNVERIFIED_CONTAM: hypothetical protein FKN15_051068 [Acipenser sinensis]
MDRNALAELLQALESRRDAEERRREERYTALIERRVHDTEKLGLDDFPPVESSIAALVQVPNFALLSKEGACPNKQCWVTEIILQKAYSAGVFTTRLGNYSSILAAYQSQLLRSLSRSHRPSPQQLDELSLVNKNLWLSKLN